MEVYHQFGGGYSHQGGFPQFQGYTGGLGNPYGFGGTPWQGGQFGGYPLHGGQWGYGGYPMAPGHGWHQGHLHGQYGQQGHQHGQHGFGCQYRPEEYLEYNEGYPWYDVEPY